MIKRIIRVLRILFQLTFFFLKSPKKLYPASKKIFQSIRVNGLKVFFLSYLAKLRTINSETVSNLELDPYNRWILNFEVKYNRSNPQEIESLIKNTKSSLSFLIFMSVESSNELSLTNTLNSISIQSYPFWEVCIVADSSISKDTKRILEKYGAKDKRFKVSFLKTNTNMISEINLIIENTRTEYITFLLGNDIFDKDCLYEFAKILFERKNIDIIYSDEDKIDEKGKRFDPYLKPDWSPELLLSNNYIGNLVFYNKTLLTKIGFLRTEFYTAHTYDLTLRAVEHTKNIYHIPKVLYHSYKNSDLSSFKDNQLIFQMQKKALEQTLTRRGLLGTVLSTPLEDKWRVRPQIVGDPRVSVIIPTAGKSGVVRGVEIHYLLNCLTSIIEKSTYKNLEIVVLHNGDLSSSVETQLKTMKQVVLVHYDKREFNLSEKMNLGVEKSSGDYVIIFNDDIEVKSPDWIESLLEYAQLEGVGAVGAKLLFENNTIQHIGVVWTYGGPSHASYGAPENDIGHGAMNVLTHNRFATTGACLMVRKSIFEKLNGWDLNFPLNYNDVDFCLRLVQAGYRNIVCPDSVLYHYESASKEGTSNLELLQLIAKWGNLSDPYYNPNFYRVNPFFGLNWEDSRHLHGHHEFWLLRKVGERKSKYPLAKNSISFSILTPVHNTDKKFLKELAKTILNQTYKNFEWVIVDNGSTKQETLELLKSFSNYTNVKVIYSESNLGIIRGTQLAFQNATGDYVLPVDHDDLITYDALQVFYHTIVNNNFPAILYSDEDKTNPESRNSLPFLKPDWDPVMFFNNCYIAHLCAFNRKIAIELDVYSDTKAEGCHDWDTLYRFIRKGHSPLHIPEVLYSWRIHPQSTASGVISVKPYTVNSQLHVLKQQFDFLGKINDYELIENKLHPNSGMWSIRRKTDFSYKVAITFIYNGKNEKTLIEQLQKIESINTKLICDIFVHSTQKENLNLEKIQSIYTKGKIFLGNYFENQQNFTTYKFAFFISDQVSFDNTMWLNESLGMLDFFDDSVLVSGKIKTNDMYLYTDSYFDKNSNILNPGFANPLTSGGYYATIIVQKTADVVSPDFWAVRTSFLTQIYKEEIPNVTIWELGTVFSILAKNKDKRVIYSPYIEFNFESISGDNKYSSLMSNDTNYKVTNFKNQHFVGPAKFEIESLIST